MQSEGECKPKNIITALNDFCLVLSLLCATIIGYLLGGIPYMFGAILICSLLIPIFCTSGTLKSNQHINRYFGTVKNYIRLTKSLFYIQGFVVGALFSWHFGTIFFN